MLQPDPTPKPRKGLRTTLAIAAVTSAGALAFALPATSQAQPPPSPSPNTNAAPPPADPAPPPQQNPLVPQYAPPPAADPNAPPDPNAAQPAPPPEPGRVNNAAGAMSFVVPAGWASADASRLTYGSALLVANPPNGTPVPATDTSILLGKLDLKLFAGAEPDNTKAAVRLASDMGEFFMPYPGTRINQETTPLNAGGMPGAASYYEVKFTDTNRPNGQIWAAAIGTTTARQGNVPARNDRWFVVWLGNANHPVDKAAAKALAESIRPWAPPPPPEAPASDQNAAPGAPGAPPAPAAPGQPPVGVPVPVNPQNAPGMMPPA